MTIETEEKLISHELVAQRHKEIVKRLFEEIIKQGNLSMIDKILAPNYRLESPFGSITYGGRAGFKDLYTKLAIAFPCFHIEIQEIFAEYDKVAVRYKAHGTHEGEFMGISPTGKKWTLIGTDTFKLVDNKIVEHWCNFDRLGIMQQLGLKIKAGDKV